MIWVASNEGLQLRHSSLVILGGIFAIATPEHR